VGNWREEEESRSKLGRKGEGPARQTHRSGLRNRLREKKWVSSEKVGKAISGEIIEKKKKNRRPGEKKGNKNRDKGLGTSQIG